MKNGTLFSVCLALVLGSFAHGQFLPYKDMFSGQQRPPEGSYFVVISADWCRPCQELKAELANLGALVYECDYDRQRNTASALLEGRTLPQLYRFDVGPDVSWRRIWNPQVMALTEFMKMPPKKTPISDQKRILANQQKILSELAAIRAALEN